MKINPHDVWRMAQDDYRSALSNQGYRAEMLNAQMAGYRGLAYNTNGLPNWLNLRSSAEDRTEESYNIIRPTVRAAVAATLRSMPAVTALPSNSAKKAQGAAKTVRALFRSFFKIRVASNGEPSSLMDHNVIYDGETKTLIHGAGWYKVVWDYGIGPIETRMEENGGKTEEVQGPGGDVALLFADIHEVIPDPNAHWEKEIRYVVHRRLISEALADELFPKDLFGDSTKGRLTSSAPDHAPLRDRDYVERDIPGESGVHDGNNNVVEVIEMDYAPSGTYPKGLVVSWAGGVLLAVSELPGGIWPWVLRRGPNIIPGQIYGDGLVRDILGPQERLNKNLSKVSEIADLVLNNGMLVPRGAGVDVNHIADFPGYILEYNASVGRPEWTQPPPVPPGLFEHADRMTQMIRDISGRADIESLKQSTESGRQLNYLVELQEGAFAPDYKAFQIAIMRICAKALALYHQFCPEGRMLRLVGDNDRWYARQFKAKDFQFDDVVMEQEEQVTSTALKMSNADRAMEIGGLADTPEAERWRKLVGMPLGESMLSDQVDRDRAEEEILKFLEAVEEADATIKKVALRNPMQVGPEIEASIGHETVSAAIGVDPLDAHAVHLDIHREWMMTPEFRDLPSWARMLFMDHYIQHEQAFAAQQVGFGQQQQTIGATSAGPPPPSAGIPSPTDGGFSDVEGVEQDAAQQASDQAEINESATPV